MTVDDVIAWVKKIEEMKGDDEGAHAEQDELLIAVLTAIANGDNEASTMADEALKVLDIEFSRWYA
jgi:hypothetical protein